jgi:hypothetical protein
MDIDGSIRTRMSGAVSPSCARIHTQYRLGRGTEFLRLKMKSNIVPSNESTPVLTRLRRVIPENYFSGEDFFPRHRGFPLAQFFFRQSEQKLDAKQLVLCSLGAEVREAGTTRRFRFLNWNIHVFQIPFGPWQKGLNL